MPAWPNHQDVRPAYVQATDPGAVGYGVHWVDTSGAQWVVKCRNAANSGWNTLSGLKVRKSTTLIGTRDDVNLVPGPGIDLQVADDGLNKRVNITVNNIAAIWTGGSFFAAWGDGNAQILADRLNTVQGVGVSPANIGITVARCVKFYLPVGFTCNNVYLFGLGASVGEFSFAIYPYTSAGGNALLWNSAVQTFAANTWLTIATGGVALAASQYYIFCAAVNANANVVKAVAASLPPAGTNVFGAGVAPLGGRAGIAEQLEIAVPAGVWPATQPAIAAENNWVNGVPYAFLGV